MKSHIGTALLAKECVHQVHGYASDTKGTHQLFNSQRGLQEHHRQSSRCLSGATRRTANRSVMAQEREPLITGSRQQEADEPARCCSTWCCIC
jgi:hypothetical protein